MLDRTKTYIIDLDGTMYKGNDKIPAAIDFIDYLQAHQIAYVFATNNAMRTPGKIREKMEMMGFRGLRDEDFFTSAMASVSYIKKISEKRRVYCIGEEGLHTALEKGGFTICEEEVDFVFVGLHRKAEFSMYSKAFQLIRQGARLIGTNSDRRLPQGDSYVLGNGAILAMLMYASEANALIIGKPSNNMMEETVAFIHKEKDACVVIGDNLETDIAFAYDNQVESIMVCTGVHTKEDAYKSDKQPDHIVSSLSELI